MKHLHTIWISRPRMLEFEFTGWWCPMVEVARSAQIVRFGVFEADLQTGELRKNGVRVPLQGQPFQVCAILLSHAGELVSREELRQKVWPEDTFVDFDQALNTAITKIRTALGDEPDNPRFVETLPRRGYRFIGPVDKPSPLAPSPTAPKGRFERLTAKARWISVGATLLALLSGIGVWRFSRKTAESLRPSLEVVPLVVMPGDQAGPGSRLTAIRWPSRRPMARIPEFTLPSSMGRRRCGWPRAPSAVRAGHRMAGKSGLCATLWKTSELSMWFRRLAAPSIAYILCLSVAAKST
jgi:DNA-binding winged helix-turn-helix (wHTH) protein